VKIKYEHLVGTLRLLKNSYLEERFNFSGFYYEVIHFCS